MVDSSVSTDYRITTAIAKNGFNKSLSYVADLILGDTFVFLFLIMCHDARTYFKKEIN